MTTLYACVCVRFHMHGIGVCVWEFRDEMFLREEECKTREN